MADYCPKCSSKNMVFGDPVVSEQAFSIALPFTCVKCKHEWEDNYRVTDSEFSEEEVELMYDSARDKFEELMCGDWDAVKEDIAGLHLLMYKLIKLGGVKRE